MIQTTIMMKLLKMKTLKNHKVSEDRVLLSKKLKNKLSKY